MAYRLNVGTYSLIIDGMTASGTLTLAAGGFTTDGDTDNDVFKPSRLQTASIRVIDTGGHEWRNMLPTNDAQYSAILYDNYDDTNNRQALWRGYLKAQAYSSDFADDPQTVELLAQCPLSALQSFDINSNLYESATFGQLLEHCATNHTMSGTPFKYFYFPDDNIDERLSCKFSWALLYEMNDAFEREAKYNCLEALEEFCRFFGFTMQYLNNGDEQGIMFVANDKAPDYYYFSITQLQNYNKGQTLQPAHRNVSSLNIDSANYFHNTGNQLELVNGVRKVEVVADMNNNLLNWSAETDMKRHFLGPTHMASGWTNEYFTAIRGLGPFMDTATIPATTFQCKDYEISFPETTLSQKWGGAYGLDALTINNGARPIYCDSYKGEAAEKKTIDWTFAWQVKCVSSSSLTTATTGAKMRTRLPIMLKGGYLCISATTYVWMSINGNLQPGCNDNITLYAYLKIGDYYYDPLYKKWVSGYHSIAIPLEGEGYGSKGNIKSNVDLMDGFIGYNGGYVIPCGAEAFKYANWSNGYEGIVELCIIGASSSNGYNYCINLEGLTLTYLPQYYDSQEANQSEKKYTATNTGGYMDEKSVSTIFASNSGNIIGSSILFKYTGPVSVIKTFGSTSVPEQQLANRIANYYSKAREILTLRFNLYRASSFPLEEIYHDSKHYTCIAVSRDYDNDEAEVTVVER